MLYGKFMNGLYLNYMSLLWSGIMGMEGKPLNQHLIPARISESIFEWFLLIDWIVFVFAACLFRYNILSLVYFLYLLLLPWFLCPNKHTIRGKTIFLCISDLLWYLLWRLIGLKTCTHKKQVRACDISAQNSTEEQKTMLARAHFCYVGTPVVPWVLGCDKRQWEPRSTLASLPSWVLRPWRWGQWLIFLLLWLVSLNTDQDLWLAVWFEHWHT